MKKFTFALTAILFTILLTCTAFAGNSKEIRNKTAQFLLEKSNSAMENVKSFKVNGWTDFIMAFDIDGATESESVSMVIDALVELPGKIYVKYGMDTEYGIFDSFEIYFNEDGLYTRIPGMTDGWEYSEESAGMYEMMTEIMANGADYSKMFTEKYPELAALEAEMNSKLDYSKNATINGKAYYVVTMDLNLASIMDNLQDYMYDIYSQQESFMYEGYADEAMAGLQLVLDKMEANILLDMYISKDDYSLGYLKMNMAVNLELEELLGSDMSILLDCLINYSDYNASLPFPEM